VLVHGSRPQIEAQLKRRKTRSHYAKGLRITDPVALECVKEAVGLLRVEIDALLALGLPNSPMAGAAINTVSGNFITAQPIGVHDGIDFQYTGTVRKVDTQAISGCLDTGNIGADCRRCLAICFVYIRQRARQSNEYTLIWTTCTQPSLVEEVLYRASSHQRKAQC